jgi:hypothetical protein
LVLLMIFSMQQRGPSDRWCGHTGATLSSLL